MVAILRNKKSGQAVEANLQPVLLIKGAGRNVALSVKGARQNILIESGKSTEEPVWRTGVDKVYSNLDEIPGVDTVVLIKDPSQGVATETVVLTKDPLQGVATEIHEEVGAREMNLHPATMKKKYERSKLTFKRRLRVFL